MSITHSDVLPEGYQLHWYKIKSILGRGGFGITYLALDENLDQLVAIKEYLPTDVASRNSDQTVHPSTGEKHELYCWGLERFLKEGKILAKFKHPNIIRVLSVFEKNNTAYMVMEFEHGKDLSTLSKKGRLFEEDELIRLFIPVIDGLTQVHDHGFIHRDIKPANIYIRETDSSAVLLDFGAARLATEKKTQAFTRFITYGYAPLEQYQEDGKQGSWTDTYSLGATLYFLITGRLPQDALRRGADLFDRGIDSYEPLTQVAAGKYSENFLLAIDNALMFRIQERPENLLIWRAMLLGEATPNALPESMTATNPGSDKTLLVPDHKKKRQHQPVLYQGADHASENDKTVFMPGRQKKSPEKQLTLYQGPKIGDMFLALSFLPATKSLWIVASIIGGVILVIIMGLTLLSTESTSSPHQDLSQKEIIHKNEGTKQAEQIAMLIQQAEESFFAERIISPLENSATYFYKKALTLEPANQEAIAGINNILAYYRTQITKSIAEQEDDKAEKYIQIIDAIEPGSIIASNMRLEMEVAKQQRVQEKEQADNVNRQVEKGNEEKDRKIKALLIEAERHYSSKNISIPIGNSAFDSYQKVLELAPTNESALQGIEKILFFYEERFNMYLARNDLINTFSIINTMERIAPNSSATQQLRRDYMFHLKK